VQCNGAYLFDVAAGSVLRHFTPPSGPPNSTFGTLAGDVLLADFAALYRLDGSTGALVMTYPDPDAGSGTGLGAVTQHGTSPRIGRSYPQVPGLVYVSRPHGRFSLGQRERPQRLFNLLPTRAQA
jgi:hypothetical protein